MYEELIKALHGWNVYGQHLERCNCELAAADAIESLTGQLTALQSENAEKDKRISRVEAERDVLLEYANAQMECEMCKNDTFCPMENPMPENCALCELKPKCPCHPCKWEWRGAQGEV